MTIVYQDNEYRKYEPELVEDAWGNKIWIQLCEELIEGRWEPFYATIGGAEA